MVKMFTSHALPVRALAWTPESQVSAKEIERSTSGPSRPPQFMRRTSDTLIAHPTPLRCTNTSVWSVQFLFSGSDDRRIVLYDIKAGRSTASERGGSVIDIHGHKGWVLGLSVSDDGKSLVSG